MGLILILTTAYYNGNGWHTKLVRALSTGQVENIVAGSESTRTVRKEYRAPVRYNKKAGLIPAFLTHVLQLRTLLEQQSRSFLHVTSCGYSVRKGRPQQ